MGRRRNAISSEDSDDDRPDEASASNPGANPQSASKGKKWTPGMSGKEQKARAKEQRFEQHRRKADRPAATRDDLLACPTKPAPSLDLMPNRSRVHHVAETPQLVV